MYKDTRDNSYSEYDIVFKKLYIGVEKVFYLITKDDTGLLKTCGEYNCWIPEENVQSFIENHIVDLM